MDNNSQISLIGKLNDCYRRDAGWNYSDGDTPVQTAAQSKARRILTKVWQAIRTYQEFELGDAERNCGTVKVEGVTVVWQINYLDRWSDAPSANPADPRVTRRTITLTMEVPD
ncbi:MAG TPA: DUF3768 domain-containing protein [Stellaceae bacterium]|nr:DUF3768 domain-containing protein [Stellaceae bacterium]